MGDFWSTRSSSEHSDFFEVDFVVGIFGALGAARSTRIFLRGFFGGDLLEHSEQLGALGFFFEGIFWGGGVCFGLKVLEKIKK